MPDFFLQFKQCDGCVRVHRKQKIKGKENKLSCECTAQRQSLGADDASHSVCANTARSLLSLIQYTE